MAGDKQYLQKWKNTWYVVVEVPKRLRREGVPPRFITSLKTANLAEANRLKHPHVAEFLRRVDELRGRLSTITSGGLALSIFDQTEHLEGLCNRVDR
jgi:hypothetical protein